jgi:hypothetical protein
MSASSSLQLSTVRAPLLFLPRSSFLRRLPEADISTMQTAHEAAAQFHAQLQSFGFRDDVKGALASVLTEVMLMVLRCQMSTSTTPASLSRNWRPSFLG